MTCLVRLPPGRRGSHERWSLQCRCSSGRQTDYYNLVSTYRTCSHSDCCGCGHSGSACEHTCSVYGHTLVMKDPRKFSPRDLIFHPFANFSPPLYVILCTLHDCSVLLGPHTVARTCELYNITTIIPYSSIFSRDPIRAEGQSAKTLWPNFHGGTFQVQLLTYNCLSGAYFALLH